MSPLQQSVLVLLPIPLLIFWMWMFSDMMRNDEIPTNLKFQWFLAFIFLNIFAAILYYFQTYSKK